MSGGETVQQVSSRLGRKVFRVNNRSHFDVDDRFDILAVLGQGSYGIVCSAFDMNSRRKVAIKKIERVFDDLVDGRRIWRELVVLRLLTQAGARHTMKTHGLLRPSEDISKFSDVYLVSDLYASDLSDAVYGKPMDEDAARRVASHVLMAVADVHQLGIVHRDIKPANVLLDQTGAGYLCDFGLSKGGMERFKEPVHMTDRVVTRYYRAPEVLFLSRYSYPIDVWAVGCVVAECLLGDTPFAGRDYMDQFRLVCASVPHAQSSFIVEPLAREFFDEQIKRLPRVDSLETRLAKVSADARAVDLVMKALTFDPSLRPSAEELLRHPFVAQHVEPRRGHPLTPCTSVDWSVDATPVMSEKRLRRLIWEELFVNSATKM